MALQNTWLYTKTLVFSKRSYSDQQSRYPDGHTPNFKVLKDNFNPGVDKKVFLA